MGEAEQHRMFGKGRLQVFASAAVVAGLLIAAAWWTWSTYQLNKIHVSWTGIPVCSGSTVQNDFPDGPDEPPVLAVASHPDMHCTLHIEVINYSKHTITVDKITAPWLGPGAGTVIKAVPVDGGSLLTSPTDDLDADYAVGETLDPDSTMNLKVAFVFRESGCSSDGWVGLPHWPAVDVSALGRTVTREASQTLNVRGFAKFSEC